MKLKKLITDSFKFLVFDWRFFPIVLAFLLFLRYYPGIQCQVTGFCISYSFLGYSERAQTGYLMESILSFIKLLFWIPITILLIKATKEYFDAKRKITFNTDIIKRSIFAISVFGLLLFMIDRLIQSFIQLYLFGELTRNMFFIRGVVGLAALIMKFTIEFLVFLGPVAIVLSNKTAFEGIKESIGLITGNLRDSITFYLIITFVFGFIFVLPGYLPLEIELWYIFLTGESITMPRFPYIALIFNVIGFIFYQVAVTGFYLNLTKRK